MPSLIKTPVVKEQETILITFCKTTIITHKKGDLKLVLNRPFYVLAIELN
jgi:hypothetical protein